MLSQEEYLDQLLKGITEDPIVEEPIVEEPFVEESSVEESSADVPMVVKDVMQEPIFDEQITEDDFDEGFEKAEFDDDILKKMVLENATIEDVLSEEDEIDDDSGIMSVEEIEEILADNRSEADLTESAENDLGQDEDLMSLLSESSDNELQDIYDMLHKSDNNEVLDDELFAQLQGGSDLDEAAALQAILDASSDGAEFENSTLSEREKKAQEKKRLKEEKAEAKRAAKEAKKAAKEAKKAEKSAQKATNKATEEVAKENAEAAATPIAAGEDDLFESIDELSTADMLDLQDLLAFADMQSPAEDTIAELQQSAKAQTRPVMVDVPENDIKTLDVNESTEADMQEIDELLSLAGISGVSEDSIVGLEAVDESSAEILFEGEEIRDITHEKEKKGLFARILDFLTETDEDDEVSGTEDIPLSDENRNILEEMDKEEKAAGKKKGKKGKKGQKAQVELETLDDDEAVETAAKAKKGKKPKKDKKAKKEEHLKVMPMEAGKKLPTKVILSTVALCATILVVVLLLVNLGGDFALKREAKKAYYREDYETCYQTLYGKELNESEQVMFAKSESILRIRLRMRQYEVFAGEQSEVEALDVLIQTVHEYEDLYEYASKWNATDEVSVVYAQILGVLQDKYSLSESDALEIAAEPDDVEYTKIVTAVAEGGSYDASNSESMEPEKLPDMLPEELQFPENNGGQ